MLSAVSIRGIRARGVALAGVLLAVLMMFGSVFAAAPAFAAPINATISEAKFDRSSAGYGESIGFSFNWAVPNGSVAGDTFTIVLPNEIRPANTADFVLNSSAHGPVGKAVWSGNTATITLTNAVNGLSNVKGNGYFNVGWDGNAVDRANGGSYNLYFSGTNNWSLPLTLLPDGLGGDGQSTSKVGMWLSRDQGASSPLHQLGWGVYLDTGTDKHVTAPVVITDTPGPTSIIDITTVVGYNGNATIPTNRYTVVREGERGVRIELRGNHPGETAIYDGENIVFRYKSDILPGDTGIFTNSAVVSGIKSAPEAVSARILRDGAGGNGDGDLITLAPVVPEVSQSACAADGSMVDPKVVLAETEGVTYSTQGEVVAGGKVTVTATAGEGFVLSPVDGWTLSEDKLTATMIVELEDIDCEEPLVEAAPVVPQVTQASCSADGTVVDPKVVLGESEGIKYTSKGEVVAGGKVTVTAAADEGFVLKASEGWTLSGDKLTATRVVELADVDCEKPLVEAAPISPEVTQASCSADGTVVDPKVVLGESEGIKYTSKGDIVAGGKVTVTATAGEGFVLSPVDGWTLSEDKLTATMIVELADVDCKKPVDNSTDTPAKKPVVKDPTLAKTGGLEPGIFLAPAAALLLIAGLAFVAAKRRVQ